MLIADLLLHPDRARLCGILAGSLLVGNLALGGLRLLTRPAEGSTVQVAAIQGNMSSLEKWSGNSVSAERYETLAAARARLSRLARETGATLLVGVFTSGTGTESNRQYNSVVAFLPDGSMCETVYSKQKPVPFGEFVPYRELVMLLVPPLADIGMLENDLLVGDRSEVFDLGVGRVGSLICFDSIYTKAPRWTVCAAGLNCWRCPPTTPGSRTRAASGCTTRSPACGQSKPGGMSSGRATRACPPSSIRPGRSRRSWIRF